MSYTVVRIYDEMRAQQILDLLRSGYDVAVVGQSGSGKSVAMNIAEQRLGEYELGGDRVYFFNGSERPPSSKRSEDHLFVAECDRAADIPRGYMVVPVLPPLATGMDRMESILTATTA